MTFSLSRKIKFIRYLKSFSTLNIIRAVILLDDYDGLSNWDCYEVDSLKEAIYIIDGGYGILRDFVKNQAEIKEKIERYNSGRICVGCII